MKKFHIFAGGTIKDRSFVKINPDEQVICADSGFKYAQALGIVPDCVVGDFDSWKGDLPKASEIIRCIPEKDDTDTLVALKKAISNGAREVIIYGAFGGRFDHMMGNVQLLKYALDRGCHAELVDGDNIVMICRKGEYRIKRREGWYFAVLAYSPEVKVASLSGVKYPLKDAVLTNGYPLGVSNEFASNEAILEISEGTALVVMSKK